MQVSAAAGLLDMQMVAEPGSPAGKTGGAAVQGGTDLISILTAMLSSQQGAAPSTGAGAATHGKAIDKQIADIDDVVPAQELTIPETAAQSASGTATGKSLRSHVQPGKEKDAPPAKNLETGDLSFALTGDAATNILMPVVVPVLVQESVVYPQTADNIRLGEMTMSLAPASLPEPNSQEKGTTIPANKAEEESNSLGLAEANSDKRNTMTILPEAAAVSMQSVAQKAAKPDVLPAQMKPPDVAAAQPMSSSALVQAYASAAEQGRPLKVKPSGKTEDVSLGSSSEKAVYILQPEQAGADAAGIRTAATLNSLPSHNAAAKNGQDVPQMDPFQRMDTGESQVTLLKTAPHEIAVGIRDPSLGWIEIQTQSSPGHVSASLATFSTEAHTVLASEVPALTQFMAERNVPVHTVNVAMQGGDAGSGQSNSGSENARQQAFAQSQSAPVFNSPEAGSSEESFYQERSGNSSRISVRA